MTNTPQNRFYEDISRLMTDAAGVAQGASREVKNVFQHQLENIVREMNVVSREEFDVVKEMATQARLENETLKAELAVLNERLDKLEK